MTYGQGLSSRGRRLRLTYYLCRYCHRPCFARELTGNRPHFRLRPLGTRIFIPSALSRTGSNNFEKMDDVGPSNWEDPPYDSSEDETYNSSLSDEEMDEDVIAEMRSILGAPIPQGALCRLVANLHVLTMVDEMERGREFHDCPWTGQMRISYYMRKPKLMRARFRMYLDTFQRLSSILQEKMLLKSTQHLTVDEQLFIFLSVVCKAYTNADIADMWQRSGETISRWFTHVLEAVCTLGEKYIRPNYNKRSRSLEANKRKYLPWFKNCVGAVDETHIPVTLASSRREAYYNRKGVCTQNVLAVCDFDMNFTYMLPGWKGSAHDTRVLRSALDDYGFPRPPPGKYLLVDSGYANTQGFIAPFWSTTYHIKEFRARRGGLRGRDEVFNYTHSSLRTVIERTFAVYKNRFSVLKRARLYLIEKQCMIPYACAVLHNFLNQDKRYHDILNEYGEDGTIPEDIDPGANVNDVGDESVPDGIAEQYAVEGGAAMAAVRDATADEMFAAYQRRPWYRL